MLEDSLPKTTLSTKATIISIGRLAITLSHFMAYAILSYVFSKTEYGAYRQVWLVYNTMLFILSLGLPTSISYFIPQMKGPDRKALHVQSFFLLAVTGLILGLILFFGGPLISAGLKNPGLEELLRYFSLVPILTFPTLYYQELFICLNKEVTATKLSLIFAFGHLFSLTFPLLFGWSIKEIFISFTLFSLIRLIVVSLFIFRPFQQIDMEWHFTLLRKQLKYAIPLGLATIVAILNKQIDKFIISSVFSLTQFATYMNGAFEIPLIGIITGSITAVLIPEFVRLWTQKDSRGIIQIWHSSLRRVALIFYPLTGFLMVYAPEFITLLFSQKYAQSSGIFRIYLLSLLTRITNFGAILLSIGLSAYILRYAAASLLLNILLNLLFIKIIGFPGPAVASVIVIHGINLIQLNRISKETQIPFKNIMPWKTLGQLCLISFIAACGSAVIKHFLPVHTQVLSLLSGCVVFIIIFLGLGLIFGIITRNDLHLPLRITREIMK